MEKLPNFNLNTVMSSVIERGVLFRDSGLWIYYLNDTDFDNQIESITQKSNEDFELFIKRVVLHLMKLDEMRDEPLTQINYAIYCTMKNDDSIGKHMPSLEEVRKAVDEMAKKSTAPDAETPDWLRADIERGVNWALNYVTKKSKQGTATASDFGW